MGDAREDRSSPGGLPWASLLDPVANARALGEVQAQGLRAAGELVERFVRSVEQPDDGAAEGAPTPAGGAALLLEGWIELMRRTADSIGRLADPAPGNQGDRRGVEVDLTSGRASRSAPLTVLVEAGRSGCVEVWLHNGTAEALGPVSLLCSTPLAPDGTVLTGSIVFDPARIEELPARSSRGVVVTVVAEGQLAPGTYRSLVQATGAPEVWLPLEVVVQAADA